ncbi:Bcr/CflA family efflux MFS transporter [Corynebacterium efficiens]|uniref:Putative transport protein n=1 Tax=Corynebacterium efficiens (strain DSM 44549 / YS-314 / AJ 12310 / JCM 11189 / NBRC 100395) TaxID=196164 RepID=Q8FSI7_COREF|nr:Bcr/CflA family efflux MFS transporter [Corynebacterium efficiens]BAC17214.1 putative transport protein [Corynebacterium efficiens YS-314]
MSTPTDTARRSDTAAVALTGGLVALLVLVSAMPPLGTAAYLAGLPMAAEDLGITTGAAQLTLTVYILGLALGQIVIGPLSDRFGRRRPLLVGIIAFVLFSISISFVPTLEIMLVLRLFQGIAASSGMVLGRAIVHDMVQGDRAARALNVITAAGLIVPALAPLLGSLILAFGTWRTIFLVLAGLGAVVGVWSFIRIPETHGVRAQAGPQKKTPTTPNMLRFVMYTAVVSFSFMAMYSYVSSAPFVFQQLHGFTPAGYAITGAVLSLIMAGVGIAGSRIIGRETPFGTFTAVRAVGTGLVVLFLGAVLVLATVLLELHVAWYIAALAVAVAPVALISGSATALAMDSSPLRGGASSAVIGFTQSVLGAMAPPLVGILGVDARPMAMVFVGAALLGLIASWIARPRA